MLNQKYKINVKTTSTTLKHFLQYSINDGEIYSDQSLIIFIYFKIYEISFLVSGSGQTGQRCYSSPENNKIHRFLLDYLMVQECLLQNYPTSLGLPT